MLCKSSNYWSGQIFKLILGQPFKWLWRLKTGLAEKKSNVLSNGVTGFVVAALYLKLLTFLYGKVVESWKYTKLKYLLKEGFFEKILRSIFCWFWTVLILRIWQLRIEAPCYNASLDRNWFNTFKKRLKLCHICF